MTCSRFQTEDPQILGTTVENFVAGGTCHARFAHPLFRSMSKYVRQLVFVLFIIQLRNKFLPLPKLHTAEVHRAAGGNLHLAVKDETENYEGRIAFKSMTVARCSTNIFSKVTVDDRHTW